MYHRSLRTQERTLRTQNPFLLKVERPLSSPSYCGERHSCPSFLPEQRAWSTERTHRPWHHSPNPNVMWPSLNDKGENYSTDHGPSKSIQQAEGGTQQHMSPLFPLGHGPGVPHDASEAMLPGRSSSRYTDVKYEPNGKVSHSFTLPSQPQRTDTQGFWRAVPVPSTPSVQRQCCQCHEEANRFDPAGPQ